MSTDAGSAGGSGEQQPGCTCVNALILAMVAGLLAAFVGAGLSSGGGWGAIVGLVIGLPLAVAVGPVIVVGTIVIAVKLSIALYDLLTTAVEGPEVPGMLVEMLGDEREPIPHRRRSRALAIAILSGVASVWVIAWMAVWLGPRGGRDAGFFLCMAFGMPASAVLMWGTDRYERRQAREARPAPAPIASYNSDEAANDEELRGDGP